MLIQNSAHEDAHIIFGSVIDETMDGQIRVTVIATGFDSLSSKEQIPVANPESVKSAISMENNKTPQPAKEHTSPYKHLKSLANAIREDNPEEYSASAVNFDIPTFLRKHAD